MNSRPTSSLRHINEINHKRALTHSEKMFEALHILAKKLFERYVMKKGIHTVNLKKQKYVHATVLLFILYSI